MTDLATATLGRIAQAVPNKRSHRDNGHGGCAFRAGPWVGEINASGVPFIREAGSGREATFVRLPGGGEEIALVNRPGRG